MGDVPRRTWGPKYALTESVNWLTHPVKTPKNAHNTRFFQLARSDRAGRSVALGPEIRGRTALALRLSLRHRECGPSRFLPLRLASGTEHLADSFGVVRPRFHL